jgi:hypothetical protein
MNKLDKFTNILNNIDYLKSSLPESIFQIEGMSGKFFKNLLNNLLKEESIKNYLEIGVWKGSTCISALYENNNLSNYFLIDNFSLFDGPKDEFKNNFEKFLNKSCNIIDADCFSLDLEKYNIKNIDVYFFDGPHDEIDQYNALKYYYDSLNDCFIFIVDDWNWEQVRKGTNRAIQDLNLKIYKQIEYFTDYPDANTWWNGCAIFLLKK